MAICLPKNKDLLMLYLMKHLFIIFSWGIMKPFQGMFFGRVFYLDLGFYFAEEFYFNMQYRFLSRQGLHYKVFSLSKSTP